MRVGAVLRDDDVGQERRGDLGQDRPERGQPAALAGARIHRQVERRPGRRPLAELGHEARPREERSARLVDRQGDDARIGRVDGLDPVAVVDVEVDVEHAQAIVPGPRDREGRVVVDAEPGRPVGHRVVEPAAGVERVGGVAAEDRLHRPDRAAGDRRGGLVHAGEGGRVTRPDARLPARERLLREPPHDVDVAGLVDPAQLAVRRRLGRQLADGAAAGQLGHGSG